MKDLAQASAAVRYKLLDALKGFCILTVVYRHNVFDVSWAVDTALEKWMTSFHMFLFFAISGFLFSYKKMNAVYLRKKAKALLVPYVIWGVVVFEALTYVKILIRGNIYGVDLKTQIIGILTGRINGLTCWFLLALFMVFVLEFLIKLVFVRKAKTVNVLAPQFILVHIALLVGGYFLPTSIGSFYGIKHAMIACFFFYLGMVIKELIARWGTKKAAKYRNNLWPGLALIIIATVLNIFNGEVTFSGFSFSIVPLTLLNAILFTFGFILLFLNSERFCIKSKLYNLFCTFGKYSLEILVTHKALILGFRVVEKLLNMEIYTFPSIPATIIIALIEFILIKLVFDKVKFLFAK